MAIKLGLIGVGRIGKTHLRNISLFVPELEIKTVADPFANEQTVAYAAQFGIKNVTKNADDIFNDPEIEAVAICSSTDTHAEYIVKAARAGKHCFCEKPIATDIAVIKNALAEVKKAGIKLQVGFVRRADHNHKAVYDMVKSGKVGKPHIIKITSRDPEPPPIAYVKVSGGIFYDMAIHDFDMARFLAGDEVEEVFAAGAVLVDPAIGEAGDVDTAVVTLKFKGGTIAVIDNSRRAVYGYDQRVEVFGDKGVAMNSNDIPNTATFADANGTVGGTAYQVMWTRYEQAFVSEMKAFAKAIVNDEEPPVTGEDGLYPVLMAAAATKSCKEGRPVKISEVDV
ncbi:MAG: inositol 2-dehydrogenase [Selenomonadaceae bacterium]|nr:inositol 2-dehydrogenase [Selenomonadaceae bacterium]